MAGSCRKSKLLLVISAYALLSAYFLYRYLYVKKTISDASEPSASESLRYLLDEHGKSTLLYAQLVRHCDMIKASARPKFDRIVFLLIDAFRIDFVPTILNLQRESRMPFLEEKLKNSGIGLISRAEMPTVTTPRTTGLLSGQLPSFMNYMLHYRPEVATGDWNLVEQFAFVQHKRVVFYGDETWPELFPATAFVDVNVTNTLFIEELVQIDQNVTWNLRQRLAAPNMWNAMFLHYLGVDHIGHSLGYASNKMPGKLIEMDNVFREIYESLEKLPETSLIVVVGDHGMGNFGHGGDSYEEKHSALAFISTKPSREQEVSTEKLNVLERTVAQLDVATTIASLFGLTLDSKNEGIVITPVLERFDMDREEHLCRLLENVEQIYRHAKWMNIEVEPEGKENLITTIEDHWNLVKDRKLTHYASFERVASLYRYFLRGVQQSITSTVVDYSFLSTNLLTIILCYILAILLLVNELGLCATFRFTIEEFKKEITKLDTLTKSVTNFTYSILGCGLLTLPFGFKFFFLFGIDSIQFENWYWQYQAISVFVIFLAISLRNLLTLKQESKCHHYQEVGKIGFVLFAMYVCLHWKYLIDSEKMINYGQDIYTRLGRSPWILTRVYIFCMAMSMALGNLTWKLSIVATVLFQAQRETIESNIIFSTFLQFVPSSFCQNIVYLVVLIVIILALVERLVPTWLPRKWQPISRKDRANLLNVVTNVWLIIAFHCLEPAMLPVFVITIGVEKLLESLLLSKSNSDGHHVYHNQLFLYILMANWSHYSAGNTNSVRTGQFVYCFAETNKWTCFVSRFVSIYSGYVYWYLRYLFWLTQYLSNSYTSLPTSTKETKSEKQLNLSKERVFQSSLNRLAAVHMLLSTQSMLASHVLHEHFLCWGILSHKVFVEIIFTTIVSVIICFASLF